MPADATAEVVVLRGIEVAPGGAEDVTVREEGSARITVCRGCCCGTAKARPDVDHAAQLAQLVELAEEHGLALRRSDCLGPCEEADVVVLHPAPRVRAGGVRPVWLSLVDDEKLEVLRDWVAAGGPGRSRLPAALEPHVIVRPSRAAR